MKEQLDIRHGDLAIKFTMDLDYTFAADSNTKKYNTMYGAAEPEVVNVMKRVIRSGDTVIDGGANVGYFSLILAAMVGESGKVLAFEPGPNNLPKLKHNVAINKAKQIQVIDLPLWACQEEVTLHMAVDSGMHSLRPHQTFGNQPMESTTIDAWHVNPKLIKLDVEGSEMAALVGGLETITRCQPYVVCELNETTLNLFGETNFTLREYAKRTFNYDTFMLMHSGSYPIMVPPKVEIKTRYMNTNVLFATVEMVGKAFSELQYE